MGLFKRAAVRGVAHELMRRGYVPFASKEAADEAADAVADSMPEMPEVAPEQGHGQEDVAAIANKLMEIAQALLAQSGGGAAGGPPGGPPPPDAGPKMAAEMAKIASSYDVETLASEVAVACMDKAASETKQASNLIRGGDKGNKPEQAAENSDVGKLDQENRPTNAYVVGQGKTELDTNKGQSGSSEKAQPAPGETPSGSNSLTTDAHKSAALRNSIRKIASNLIRGGDKGNTPEQAAAKSDLGKLDQENRPEGKYKVAPGGANFSEPQAARIGVEKKVDNPPGRTVSGTNSVIEASKAAEEQAFLTLFKKCASDVGPYLPRELGEDEKIAAITHMIGFDHDGRQEYLNGLYEKVASEASKMVAALKGEEKEESKKESSLLESIRQIAAASTK